MCDTLLAPAAATRRGRMLFAKNSDRERNEAQGLTVVPARSAPSEPSLRATYITLPEAPRTYACLLSRPFWMWGAEMGVNEHGVAIGNEAMHALEAAERRPALTGMDLVRLGLERARCAAEALEVITVLLGRHGQGGDCGHLGRFYYQNGFVIADPDEAFVLETAGRDFIAQRVTTPRALSNAYSITGSVHAVSAALRERGAADGWLDPDAETALRTHPIDEARDRVSRGRDRRSRAEGLLDAAAPGLDASALMAVLRDHGPDGTRPGWSPEETQGRTLCMHAAEGPRRSQSVASMICELDRTGGLTWVTASSAPCLSLFKPLFVGLEPPGPGVWPTDRFDPEARWWRHERLHRRALEDFPGALESLAEERDALEAEFLERAVAVEADDRPAKAAVVGACWAKADAAEARWLEALRRRPRGPRSAPLHRSWARLNTVAGFYL